MRAREFIIEAVDMALIKKVADASGIANPNSIKVGQKVKLPDGTTYTVVSGDSLGSIISGRYKGSPPVKTDRSTSSNSSQENDDDDDADDDVDLAPPPDATPTPDAPEEPAGWTDSQGQPIRSSDGSQVKSGSSSTGSKPQKRPVKSGSNSTVPEPQINPLQGGVKVNSPYGKRNLELKGASKNHKGVDLKATVGTKIIAPISGEVVEAAPDSRGCGGTIAIANGNIKHRFCHCSSIDVKKGDWVEQGQVVGLTGGKPGIRGAGTSSGPHLHWEKYVSNVAINPIA